MGFDQDISVVGLGLAGGDIMRALEFLTVGTAEEVLNHTTRIGVSVQLESLA
jgi:hypothetical protein